MENRRLKGYRILKGLSQKELARKLSLSQPLISEYETGEHIPRKKRQEQIAKVLGKKVATIFPKKKRKRRIKKR